MVSIKLSDPSRGFCGGALISNQYVLTAAHCFWEDGERIEKVGDIAVTVGAHYLRATEPEARDHEVAEIRIPRNFTKASNGFDIAVLKLKTKVKFSRRVRPICLPPDNSADDYAGQVAMVSGWGHTVQGGVDSPVLMEVPVLVWKNKDCYNSYMNTTTITSNMLCAGYRKGRRDSCHNDSGGPLMLRSNRTGRWVLIGVVSWGEGCAQPNYPGVYTRLSEYIKWIRKLITQSTRLLSTLSTVPDTAITTAPTTNTTTSHHVNITTITTTTDNPNDWWNSQPLTEICGRESNLNRVVGGRETRNGAHPWMVVIKRKGSSNWFCGGTLISNQYVLTAAHCFWEDGKLTEKAGNIAVTVGAHDLRATEPEARDNEVEAIGIPNDYTSSLHGLDIAVLKLKTRVKFSGRVRPICLPRHNSTDDYAGRVAMLAGWGLTKYPGTVSPVLQELSVHVLGYQKCDAIWNDYDFKLKSDMICTGGYKAGGKGVCRGDSGGPVMLKSKSTNRWVQIGVVSWGPKNCTKAGLPDVNTRVSEHINWICKQIY
ncbi:unnamed protein product [Oppiella nova]|uniref:limulus clotting factor C n=1 Tax=Oppiella nova TaxID=334625 RepID=A0A7R9QV18_9ACAR|nr:unnamed protein product [Oppiella nova]CAG2176626.1 unnamed protein product [Oppiella nova]